MRVRQLIVAVALAACGSSSDSGLAPDSGPGAGPDAGADVQSCPRVPAAADRKRYVVVSHPFNEGELPRNWYEVLALDTSGQLQKTDVVFQMGRANSEGHVAFTPDGEVGIVVQDDGTLGVFRIDVDGQVTVIEAGFRDGFYAQEVVIAPSGDHALVLDGNWRNNGGGVYRVDIACDGSVSSAGLVTASKLAKALFFGVGNEQALVVANDAADSNEDKDAILLSWSGAPSTVMEVDAFPDNDAIVGSAALSRDGSVLMIGDRAYGSVNRVAAVTVDASGMQPLGVVDLEDPYAIVISPFGDRALVVSGFGNAFYSIAIRDGEISAPQELSYEGSAPSLPGRASMIDRGALDGLVLVADNVGVRRVRFVEGALPTDLGTFDLSESEDDLGAVVGAIGVQP